ncbi:MAG: terminase, partial [Duncaniella sp.]|nr:terminase [Duncaniella sp.]
SYVEADSRVLDEFLAYERKPNGAYGAIAGYHDDLLMTRAIGLHICFSEMPLPAEHTPSGHLTLGRFTFIPTSAATI